MTVRVEGNPKPFPAAVRQCPRDTFPSQGSFLYPGESPRPLVFLSWSRRSRMNPLLHNCIALLLLMGISVGCSLHGADDSPVVRAQDAALPQVAIPSLSSPVDEQSDRQQSVYLVVSLQDAISTSLAESAVVRVLQGGVNIASITPTDVQIAEQDIAVEQGRFQPRLSMNYDATQNDLPPNAFFGPGISQSTKRDSTNASARLSRPLTTGGNVSLGIEPPTAYLYFPDGVSPGSFNPSYSTDYVLRVRQPLLDGAGKTVNLAPIHIAQVQARQSRLELEEVLNQQVQSVIEGYWLLYAAHLRVQALRGILPVAEESVRVETLRFQADRSIPADVARAEYQLGQFERQVAEADGDVRRRSLQLRQLMGAEPDLNLILLPSEKPAETPPPEDPAALVSTAMQSRPQLNELREQLRGRQISLAVAQNRVYPDVDFRGEYRMSGLAERLNESFEQAATSDYTDWTLGVGVEIPIGNKTARSERRKAELQVARDHMVLRETEIQVGFEVTELVSDLRASWMRLQIARDQARHTQEWLRVARLRYTQPQASSGRSDSLLLALTDLQSAMRSYVDSISDLGDSFAEYSNLLAELQRAQGISRYSWQSLLTEPPALPFGHAGTEYLPGPNLTGAASHTGMGYHSYRVQPHVNMSGTAIEGLPVEGPLPTPHRGNAATTVPAPYGPAPQGHTFSSRYGP